MEGVMDFGSTVSKAMQPCIWQKYALARRRRTCSWDGRGGESEPAVGQNYDVRCQQQPSRITKKSLPVTHVTIVRPRFVTHPRVSPPPLLPTSPFMISAFSPHHSCLGRHRAEKLIHEDMSPTTSLRLHFRWHLFLGRFQSWKQRGTQSFSAERTHDI